MESWRDSNFIVNKTVYFTWENTQPCTLAQGEWNHILFCFLFFYFLYFLFSNLILMFNRWKRNKTCMGICNKKLEHSSLNSSLFFFFFFTELLSFSHTFEQPWNLRWSVVCFDIMRNWDHCCTKSKTTVEKEWSIKGVRCTTFKGSFKHKAYLAHILSIWTCVLLQQEKLIPHPTTFGAVQCFPIILWQSCYPFTVWVLVSPFLGWRRRNHIKHRAPKQNCQKGVSSHHFQRWC